MIKKSDDAIVKTDPDPTEAVKEALTLAVKNIDGRIDALAKQVQDKFDALDKATDLARQELADKLNATMETIKGMFAANKDLVDQLARANQTALTAALLTQEKSAAKTETAMIDMLKQLQSSFVTANLATNEKIDRLTSRLDTGEGRIVATDASRTEFKRDAVSERDFSLNTWALLISGAFVIVSILIALLPHLTK
jgi:hypothetical protein